MSRPMEQAYDYIRERILDGRYRPSQRLTEIELANAIGASRNTIKKALLALEKDNLVELQPNKGAFIKSYTLDEILNYLEVRIALEGLIARSAASQITDEQIQELEQILFRMEEHLKKNEFDEYSSLNKAFHNVIYNASQNQQAVEMVNAIKVQLARYHLRTILIPDRNKSSWAEHKEIFEAFRNRDEAQAVKTIIHHISNVRNTIKEYYSILV